MDCNKEEAVRARDIAEKKMENKDFVGARKFALKAQQLYPDLENIAQMLVVCDVHCSAEQKIFGNEMDWYGILQIEQTADDATIKKQYRKFALQLHPDKNKFAAAEAAFKLIGEAQRVLLDRDKRSIYDMRHRVHLSKPDRSRFSSAVRNNAKSNFTNTKTHQQHQQQSKQSVQQQQSKQSGQQQQNGGGGTFWTVCPFCSVRYQYYKVILDKPIRCQHCNKPFFATEVGKQGTSSPATDSTQRASHQQKDGFKFGAGSQGNLHAEKSRKVPDDKKSPTNASRKPNRKRKKKQVAESSESSDSTSSSDSEEDIVKRKAGFSGVENHSTYREENLRRSTRQKHEVSYKENVSNIGDGFLRPSKRGLESGSPSGDGESHGETTKVNDQNGLAADLKDEHKEVKQKQHLYSSPDSSSKVTNHPNALLYPDAEFSDFDKDKKKDCFSAGQVWAIYDTIDGMPRFYALIRKVLSSDFKLQITWFLPHSDCKDEINWIDKELPVACGKFKFGSADITDDHLMFSHLVLCEKIGRNAFKVYPRKGETWALFKNWDIKWYMDVKSHQQYEFEFVEILSDYVEGEGVYVAYLAKLKGFVSLFFRILKEDDQSFKIPSPELFRFSHRVPSFKMNGQERVGVPKGSYELDPASLPPENLGVKVGHSFSGGENARSSNKTESQKTSEGGASILNLERSSLAEEDKGSLDDIDTRLAPLALSPPPIEIPDTQFFNFDAGRSFERFQVGQIWAFYSDEDGLPKYYGQINDIETSPTLELRVCWLACCWLPENTIKWEDKDMLISCGRFKVNKSVDFMSVYSDTSSVSHQVHADAIGRKNYVIIPRKGEVWALYRDWSNKIRSCDLKHWEYDIVEVLEETDLFIHVLVLELVSDFRSVFRSKSNEGSSVNLRIPKKELLRFSHQVPAFKLTEEHGNLRDSWELDPGALPFKYYGGLSERDE